MPWRDRRAYQPGEELVQGTARKASRGLPFSPAGPCGIEWVSARPFSVVLFGTGLAEVERNDGGDSRVKRGCNRGWVTTACHRTEHDNSLGIDVRPLQQNVYSAHQVPHYPLHQAFACEQKLIAEGVASVVALAVPRLGLGPLAGAE